MQMQDAYSTLRSRWIAGERDRELALNLSFFAWMHWADPPSITGLSDDPAAAGLWHETFNYLGGEQSSDPEALFVFGLMANLFPWALGDYDEWTERAGRMEARLSQIQPSGLPVSTFEDRGEYGNYFNHHLRSWGSAST